MKKDMQSKEIRQLKAQLEAEMQTLTLEEMRLLRIMVEFIRWRRDHKIVIQGG